jgi:ApbE superfamily uncharacterized protein (UPF0280 family)
LTHLKDIQIIDLKNELYKILWRYKETVVKIKVDDLTIGKRIITLIYEARKSLDGYTRIHPDFFTSLFPLDPKPIAPEVASLMADAAYKANVGPSAAVAGALVDIAVKDIPSSFLLVENGGEIFAQVDRTATVSINAGTSPFSKHILFNLTREDGAVGIGTSSASIGHALTFGEADAATVIADTTALADAAATAICNAVVEPISKTSLKEGVRTAKKIAGVKGTVIIAGKYMIAWGDLPKFSSR